ncbi:hypothetical protein HDV05_002429 [Chytridiales sp. JEL 0842]|nr:hypothetical protein HDV05_002429 [Chytridiales sp. JEL 0842]
MPKALSTHTPAVLTFRKLLPPNSKLHVQSKRCMAPIYSSFPLCRACVAKRTGDLCRFINFRVFTVLGDHFNEGSIGVGEKVVYGYGPYFLDQAEADEIRQREMKVLEEARRVKLEGKEAKKGGARKASGMINVVDTTTDSSGVVVPKEREIIEKCIDNVKDVLAIASNLKNLNGRTHSPPGDLSTPAPSSESSTSGPPSDSGGRPRRSKRVIESEGEGRTRKSARLTESSDATSFNQILIPRGSGMEILDDATSGKELLLGAPNGVRTRSRAKAESSLSAPSSTTTPIPPPPRPFVRRDSEEAITCTFRPPTKVETTPINEMHILAKTLPTFSKLIHDEIEPFFASSTESNKAVYKPSFEKDGRYLCDTCSASIFLYYYCCCVCAREICWECYHDLQTKDEYLKDHTQYHEQDPPEEPNKTTETFDNFTIEFDDSDSISSYSSSSTGPNRSSKRRTNSRTQLKHSLYPQTSSFPEKHTTCKIDSVHLKEHMIPIHRFQVAEYEEMKTRMQTVERWVDYQKDELGNTAFDGRWMNILDREGVSIRVEERSLELKRISALDEKGYEVFLGEFSKGKPVLVYDCHKIPSSVENVEEREVGIGEHWEPEWFLRNHGHEEALVANCETAGLGGMKVSRFFEGFGKGEGSVKRKDVWKLPDWPTTTDFETKFPLHFADFYKMVPFAKYTARNGSLNIAARLDEIYLPPDLGPKMYIAYGSSDDAGPRGFGTTPMHLDMADAVNIMMYSSSSPATSFENAKPAAIWHIYPYEALPRIHAFLQKLSAERNEPLSVNPIHDQRFYLSSDFRTRLWKEHGVVGWTIPQNPGEAIYVPAGCVHQVCNYSDCIKVAADYVSPDHVGACLDVTGQFRVLEKGHKRKEDLLQLRSCLWELWRTSPYFEVGGMKKGGENGTV